MDTFYDLVFDNRNFRAEIIFVGNRCARDRQLRDYKAGALHFVRDGRAEVLASGTTPVRIEEPSLVFFPHALPHWVRAVDERGFDLVCALTHFEDAFTSALAHSFPDVLVLPLAQLRAVEPILAAFFDEAASEAPGARQLAQRLCEVVLGYLVRHAIESGQMHPGLLAAAGDPRIAAALRLVHTRYREEIDIDTLAHEAAMSRTRFIERFRALVGTSPHQYLMTYRIAMAQRLLASRVPVKAVAERVGYATVPSFVRRFKEVVGESPAAWAR